MVVKPHAFDIFISDDLNDTVTTYKTSTTVKLQSNDDVSDHADVCNPK